MRETFEKLLFENNIAFSNSTSFSQLPILFEKLLFKNMRLSDRTFLNGLAAGVRLGMGLSIMIIVLISKCRKKRWVPQTIKRILYNFIRFSKGNCGRLKDKTIM